MELLPSAVLRDPAYRVPVPAPGESGMAWLRAHVARFADGPAHARRRALATTVIDALDDAPRDVGPTASLLRALGLPDGAEAGVALAAAAYQPHAPQSADADAAAAR